MTSNFEVVDGVKFLNPSNDMVVKSVRSGSWENFSRKVWKDICLALPIDSVIVDVGAYTGYYSMVAAATRPDCTVIAIEPHPTIFQTLSENIKVNGLPNVKSSNYALSDVSEVGSLNVTNTIQHPSGSSLVDIGKPIKQKIEVSVVTGDSLIDDRVDLIKIDVEGAELKVLHGLHDKLKEYRPFCLIEILSSEVLEACVQYMEQFGYSYTRINERGNSSPFIGEDRNYIFSPGKLPAL